jgi:hypothetical protein
MNLAIDLGRYSIKFIDGDGRRHSFPSVLGEGKQFIDIYRSNNKDVIEYNSLTYTFGSTALEQASFLAHDREAQWVGAQSFLILTLAAISKITEAVNPKVRIATGLPHGDYKSGYKARVIRALTGVHTIKAQGPIQHIEILQPAIFTQSLGALWAYMLDDNGRDKINLAGWRVGVINCGSQTTEMLTIYFDGNRPTIIEDATRSVSSGFWKAAEALRDRDSSIADDFLADERLQCPKTRTEQSVIDEYNNFLLSHCNQNWGEQKRRAARGNINIFLICGGRGGMIASYLKAQDWHDNIVLLPDPQWATVQGYSKFVRRQCRERNF